MELLFAQSFAPPDDEPPQSASTPFARRLFTGICVWLAISVAVGILRAPGGWRAFERPFAASQADGQAGPG
jgi:hypothetical protein